MSTKQNLEYMHQKIEEFQVEYQRFPLDLAELRAFIRAQDHDFSPYDPWGSRYQYELLSENVFFIKSFGKDATENHLSNLLDYTYIHMESLPKRPPMQLANDPSALNLFSGAMLLAAQSPSSPYVAELYTNSSSKHKRLLIRNQMEKSFILPAFHDQVHEFFWLSNGYEIVFSASGSRRYEDGIYVWNLINNTFKNLLPELKAEFSKIQKPRLYLSLSSYDHRSQRVFVFIHEMNQAFLDPSAYFHTSNLFGIILPTRANPDEFRFEQYETANYNLFQRELNPQGIVVGNYDGYPAQNEWLELENSGSIQDVLEQWQSYCARYSKSPVFPYCLWWLAYLYHDAHWVLQATRPKEAYVLRNFGVEIAQALDQLETAPDYLRAMGLYIKTSLLEHEPLQFRVSNLHP